MSPLCLGDYLPKEFLLDWMRNFTVLHEAAKKLFLPRPPPHRQPTLVYHTIPIPKIINEESGVLKSQTLGKALFVHQLNTAGRAAAHRLGLHVVDAEAMANGLSWSQGMQDNHHPSRLVLEVGGQDNYRTRVNYCTALWYWRLRVGGRVGHDESSAELAAFPYPSTRYWRWCMFVFSSGFIYSHPHRKSSICTSISRTEMMRQGSNPQDRGMAHLLSIDTAMQHSIKHGIP